MNWFPVGLTTATSLPNTMNRIIRSFTISAALLSAASHAQQIINQPASPSILDDPGVLGRTYADIGLTLERVHAVPDAAYNAAFSGNAPLAPGVDGRLGYNYWWYNYHGAKSHYHLATGEARFYRRIDRMKLYGGAMLGYEWSRDSYNGYLVPPPSTPTTTTPTTTAPPTTTTTNYGGTTTTTTTDGTYTYLSSTTREHYGVWGLSAGLEVPFAGFAITPHVAYTDIMRPHSNWTYHYGAEVHHWFNERYGGYVDVTYDDVRHEPNSWWYTAGVRMRF